MVFQVISKLGQFLVHAFNLIDAQAPRNAVMRATGALFLETCRKNACNLWFQIDRNGHKLCKARLGVDDRGTG